MIIDATMRYCNHDSHEGNVDVASHFHKHWELVYYRCTGVSTVNNVPYPFVMNSYVVIPAMIPHSEFSRPGIITDIGFDTDLPEDLFRDCYFTDEDFSIGALVDAVVSEVQTEPAYYTLRINLLLRDILIQTLRKRGMSQNESDSKMTMIVNYLDAYCTTDVDFRALANSLNYSYDYLRHYFKERKHMSLKQYVIQRRIQLAKEYLMSDAPISHIAHNCGFASSAHFTATFRDVTGMTPTQYREKCQNIVSDGNDPIWPDKTPNE